MSEFSFIFLSTLVGGVIAFACVWFVTIGAIRTVLALADMWLERP